MSYFKSQGNAQRPQRYNSRPRPYVPQTEYERLEYKQDEVNNKPKPKTDGMRSKSQKRKFRNHSGRQLKRNTVDGRNDSMRLLLNELRNTPKTEEINNANAKQSRNR